MNVIQEKVLKRKEIRDMTERELLMELVEEKRREETLRIIERTVSGILLLVVLILIGIYGPRVYRFFHDLYSTVTSINEKLNAIMETAGSLKESLSGILRIFN